MLHISCNAAAGASRRILHVGLQPQCTRPMVRSYTAADASFSIHTPKARRRSKARDHSVSKQQRTSLLPSISRQYPNPDPNSSRVSLRNKLVLALGPPLTEQSSSSKTSHPGLLALLKAIDSQNIQSVWEAWEAIGQGNRQLSRTEHCKLLRLCSSYASGIQDATQFQQWKPRLLEFAKSASLTGDVSLICDHFRLLLASDQAEDVIEIWEDIVRIRIENGPIRTSFDEASDAISHPDTEGESFVRLDVSSQGDRIDLHDMVCLVTFACITSSRTSHLVDLFDKVEIGSPFRLFFAMSRAKRLFDSLPNPRLRATSVAEIAVDWETMQSSLWMVELARGLSSGSGGPQRIARLLGSLFSMRQVEAAYTIFQTAMRASSPPSTWLSIEKPGEATSPHPARAEWTESAWSVCLSNLIAAGRNELAKEVWKKLQERRIQLTPRIYNALLDGYGRAKNYAAAQQTWYEAVKQGSADSSLTQLPDESMYTTMISILFKARKVDEAMALLADMIAHSNRQGGKLHVQAETFNAAVHGLFVSGKHVQAQGLLDEMLKKGPAPNIGTINTFLRAYARVGDLQALASTIRLADKLKLKPDVVTFTTILDALLRKGGESATDAVRKTLGIMTSMGVQPNNFTYTAMIKACLVGAEAAQLDLASQSMLGDSPDGKARLWSSNDVRIEAALELFDRMIEAKVATSEITFSALIGGCLQNPDAVAHAFQAKVIPRHHCAAPKVLHRLKETPQVVQRWLQESPHVSLSLLLLERMKGRGLSPTPTTFRYLIEGLCSTRSDQAAFNRSMDLIDDLFVRNTLSEPSRPLGPFATSVLIGKEAFPPIMHAPSYTTWVVIFSSLVDRLEYGPRDKLATTTCVRALSTAIRLVRETGSLSGAEGGMALWRLVERAASLVSTHFR
ncbi:uncharacterized protein MEPE_06392 [Melanopsichium pennsylvanicum]|uniref:Uncharacterized protein n=2 Tax=Melanopsichium pennsylvanicum TaxID=63383 RepID=A0AAJ4XSM7_9BASI|nr:conserved hypothetical protein [Melanopsichium pennsylvanicum 4]SNX87682.1 uncharacterized protein MEPE_06392 [Melanopsichium pennsylvanicum]